MLFGNINIDGIVTDGTADVINKLQTHDLRMLSEPPDISLVSCKSCAVDPGLLSGADTNALTVLYVADGVALSVLESDEGDEKIFLLVIRNILVDCYNVLEKSLVDIKLVSSLLECYAEDLLALDRIRLI